MPKKNGKSRLVTDYRGYGDIIWPASFPSTPLSKVRDAIRQKRYKSSVDLAKANFQLVLQEDTRYVTAFAVSTANIQNTFVYTRTPTAMGVLVSAAWLSRSVARALEKVKSDQVMIYCDDLYLLSDDFQQHLTVFDQVLGALLDAGFKISADKVKIGFEVLKAFGYVFEPRGFYPCPDRVKAIKQIPMPRTQTELRRIHGSIAYFKDHIENFNIRTSAMRELLKKKYENSRNILTPEAQTEIEDLLNTLCQYPILGNFDENDQVLISTDGSLKGLGYIVMQPNKDGSNRVISYGSKPLTKAEQKNATSNILEFLALALCLKEHAAILKNRPIYLLTDHKGILAFETYTSGSQRMNELLTLVSEYQIIPAYIRGSTNVFPDMLSRNIREITPEEQTASEILQINLTTIEPPAQKLNAIMNSDTQGELEFSRQDCI